MRSLLFLVFLVFASALPARAEGVRVLISDFDCRRLVEHRPRDDVAYQPGVDVRGDPVAPADLGGGYQLDLPQVYRFDLTVQPFDLREERRRGRRGGRRFHRFHHPSRFDPRRVRSRRDADPRFEETGLVLGEVAIDAQGRAFFNGRPIQTRAQRELTQLCQGVD